MPEGPEVRREADTIAAAIVDRPLLDVELAPSAIARFRRRLAASTVTAVDTRGKAMLTRFANGLTLYSHNQLYGRWVIVPRGQLPDTNRQLRVALHTAEHSALLYSASDIRVLTEPQLAAVPLLTRLGPDVLDAELDAAMIASRLAEPRFSNRLVGALYLDQAFLAGLGNYLRSEILFVARVHPATKARALSKRKRHRLAARTLSVTQHAYETQGLTVPKSHAARRQRDGMDFESARFWVFDREGLPCYRCGNAIERDTVSSRRLYRCPSCQIR